MKSKIKKRYWEVTLADGGHIVVMADAAPKFAVACRWETDQLRRAGTLAGLGSIMEADPNKPKVEQTGYALYQRRSDAKAAAENSVPHIEALPSRESERMVKTTPIADRKVVKVTLASEIDRDAYRRFRGGASQSHRLMFPARSVTVGVATKSRVEQRLAR